MRTIEDVTHDGTLKQKNRAVALIDGLPVAEELIREAYELGLAIGQERIEKDYRELLAQNKGLEQALAAKNETVVHVETTQATNWSVVIPLLLLVAIELIRLYLQ